MANSIKAIGLLALAELMLPTAAIADPAIDAIFANGWRLGATLAKAVGPKAREIVKWTVEAGGEKTVSAEELARDMGAHVQRAIRSEPRVFLRALAAEYGESAAPKILLRLRLISFNEIPIRGRGNVSAMTEMIRSLGANAQVYAPSFYEGLAKARATAAAAEAAQVQQIVAQIAHYARQASRPEVATPAITAGAATYSSVTTGSVGTGTAATVGTALVGATAIVGPPAAVYYTLKKSPRGVAYDVARALYGEEAAERAVREGHLPDLARDTR